MKRSHLVVFFALMLNAKPLLQGAFVQQLIEAQEARGIRVTSEEETQFANQVKNLSMQLSTSPEPAQISQSNADQVSMTLSAFYSLFFNPLFIRFSTKTVMVDFFEQFKAWQDALKNSAVTIPWPSGSRGEDLKILLVQGLKEICLFGRYTKHREENLVTFKLRLQHILTSTMMDASLSLWKNELLNNNQQLSLGAFYSWDVALIKSEFKDSAALMPLFNKLTATIDAEGEQQAEKQHQQELAAEKQQLMQRKQQEAQNLRNIVSNIEQQSPNNNQETLYIDYIRTLLDPAYMDLSVKERKSIDTINEQFKKLHSAIGKTFMPVLPQEGIDTLKLLVAKALETIYSPSSGKSGGVALKNHVEFVLKTIMAINPNQSITENKIKFQWIKPLYLDNQFLTATLKNKLFAIFNNTNFQKWQASIRNYTFKVSSPVEAPVVVEVMPIAEPITEPIMEPMPINPPIIEEETITLLPLSKSRTQREAAQDPKELAKQQAKAQEKEQLRERTQQFKAKREQARQQAREQAQAAKENAKKTSDKVKAAREARLIRQQERKAAIVPAYYH